MEKFQILFLSRYKVGYVYSLATSVDLEKMELLEEETSMSAKLSSNKWLEWVNFRLS